VKTVIIEASVGLLIQNQKEVLNLKAHQESASRIEHHER